MTTLTEGPLYTELRELYDRARGQRGALFMARMWRMRPSLSAQERADSMAEVYMPVSPPTGRLLYSLVRSSRPETVVEFGMSYGISTLFLAAALRDNGTGKVVTTELNADKVAAATASFERAGVTDLITVQHGDACTELTSVDGPVGLVLLDGWKDMYVDVMKVLEPKLSPGALVIADNIDHPTSKEYVDYVREPGNGYLSMSFSDKHVGYVEISCWTGG